MAKMSCANDCPIKEYYSQELVAITRKQRLFPIGIVRICQDYIKGEITPTLRKNVQAILGNSDPTTIQTFHADVLGITSPEVAQQKIDTLQLEQRQLTQARKAWMELQKSVDNVTDCSHPYVAPTEEQVPLYSSDVTCQSATAQTLMTEALAKHTS